jgi:hypothetical protein
MVHQLSEIDEMPKGLKIANRADLILFDSAWIAGVDYDEELFDDDGHQPNEENEDEEDSYEMLEEYDGMDENDLAEIMDEPHGFHVPEETNQNEDVEQNNNDEEVDDDDDEDYEDSDADDVSLGANDKEEENNLTLCRTNQVRTPNPRYQHLHANKSQIEEYNQDTANVIAYVMTHCNYTMAGMNDIETFSFIQTYSLNQGLKRFGERGRKTAHKEMRQLHDRVVFEPIHIEDMTPLERKRAMESLIFLAEKRDETIRARMCANGSTQRIYIVREEATSPTAAADAILITGVIDVKQRRDVMTLDVPNAFVQTPIPQNGDKIIMKIRGSLVDILLEICPGIYDDYVIMEGKHKILYVRMLVALYGMIISSILWYKKFQKDIESIGFEVNPYDICVANRTVKGKQHTVTWHVDDVKLSRMWIPKSMTTLKHGVERCTEVTKMVMSKSYVERHMTTWL